VKKDNFDLEKRQMWETLFLAFLMACVSFFVIAFISASVETMLDILITDGVIYGGRIHFTPFHFILSGILTIILFVLRIVFITSLYTRNTKP